MQRRLSIGWLGGLAIVGCGPSADDFVGTYNIKPTETFTNCIGGDSEPTKFYYMDQVEILEGSTSELLFRAASCDFSATINDTAGGGAFSIPSQICVLESDPELSLELSGEGTVVDGSLTATLIGTYSRDQYGFMVRCDYQLDVVTQ
jgi:hypothetical protein